MDILIKLILLLIDIIMVTSKQLLTLVIKLMILTTHSKFTSVFRINKPQSFLVGFTNNCTVVGANNQTVLGFGNCYQNIYYINLQVGTPSQSMNVQFDTGSNILWLPIIGQTGFRPLQSSTYTKTSNPGNITYADGSSVSGFYGSDLVNLSNTAISVFPQILWVNHQGISYPPPIQGLIGMGFTNTSNILDIAYANNQISSPVFALAIRNSSFQSVIYYDGIPQQITNQTYYVSVVGNQYWQVRVIGVTVGDMDLTSVSASLAIIDSGTSFFYLNNKLFNSIIQKFFTSCNNLVNPPSCPCQSWYPTFSFMFQGIEVYIESSQYMTNIYNSKCTYLFGTISTVNQILLGDIFFRSYVITFDKKNKRLGFAGNIGLIESIQFEGVVIGGYILFAIIGIILIIGIRFFCSLQQLELKQSSSFLELFNPSLKPISSGLTQPLL